MSDQERVSIVLVCFGSIPGDCVLVCMFDVHDAKYAMHVLYSFWSQPKGEKKKDHARERVGSGASASITNHKEMIICQKAHFKT